MEPQIIDYYNGEPQIMKIIEKMNEELASVQKENEIFQKENDELKSELNEFKTIIYTLHKEKFPDVDIETTYF